MSALKNDTEQRKPRHAVPENQSDEAQAGHGLEPDLTRQEIEKGSHPGDTYVRVKRPYARLLRRIAPDYLLATDRVYQPEGSLARLRAGILRLLLGTPLPTSAEVHERLTKVKALAVFASDALSSNAYATEEILLVLVVAGTAPLWLSFPITLAIALVLGAVAFSYRQTVQVYTRGGGSYTVAKENLGTLPGLVAAAALLIDYVLTVAVSIAAGTAALTSAIPDLYPYRVLLSLAFILFIALANLRGIRESGTIFALPTYLFVFSLAGMILVGLARLATGDTSPPEATKAAVEAAQPVTLWLILRAFASGSVAMTGTEAIANGVPAFQPPEGKNAATTLAWMAAILATFFVGITFLANQYGIVPHETETVVSQLARSILGGGLPYLLVQGSTMLILILAANTSFADFPRVSSVMARDRFMPNQFTFRGERLAFSNGILVLAALAGLLILAFGGSTHALIPLYAVGVFLAFTLSQSGMVARWWRLRGSGWRRSLIINAFGATLTGVVLIIVASTKFASGAWIVVLLIPLLVLMFLGIHRHYRNVADQLRLSAGAATLDQQPVKQKVLVPVADLNQASLRALAFARSISEDVTALHVTDDPREAEALRRKWDQWANGVSLVILESPYRSFTPPLLTYIDALHQQDPGTFVTVVLPQFVPAHWWENLLHNRTVVGLKASLLLRPNTLVVNVADKLRLTPGVATLDQQPVKQKVLVPVADLNQASLRALAFAKSISPDVTAIHVTDDPHEAEALRRTWDQWA
ncbi:MAG: APC family permease, partial [Chloroflexi bacterium]|nr:APC family permease [Chloroflexota bacterium]